MRLTTKLTITFLLIGVFVFASPEGAPRVFASTDLSPILTNEFELGPFGMAKYQNFNYGDTTGNLTGCNITANSAGLATGSTTIHLIDYVDGSGLNMGYMTGLPAGVYTYEIGDPGGGGGGCGYNKINPVDYYGLFLWDGFSVDSSYSPSVSTSTTHIQYTTPSNGQVVSSTSPVALYATGYILQEDEPRGITGNYLGAKIRWNIASLAQSVQNCIDVICAQNTSNVGYIFESSPGFDLPGGSIFSVSSTTSLVLPYGAYTMTTSIIVPWSLGGLFGGGWLPGAPVTLTSVVTHFIVGTSTPFDVILGVNGTGLSGALAGLSEQDQETLFAYCNPIGTNAATLFLNTSFSFSHCLAAVFYPDWTQMKLVWDSFKNGFLSAAPWGYVTLIASELSGSATSTLPVFSVSAPSAVMGHAFPVSGTLRLDVFGQNPLASTSVFSTATSSDNKTFKQVAEPYWIIIMSAIYGFAILRLFTGTPSNGFSDSGSLGDSGDEAYRLKETLYRIKDRK